MSQHLRKPDRKHANYLVRKLFVIIDREQELMKNLNKRVTYFSIEFLLKTTV